MKHRVKQFATYDLCNFPEQWRDCAIFKQVHSGTFQVLGLRMNLTNRLALHSSVTQKKDIKKSQNLNLQKIDMPKFHTNVSVFVLAQ